MSQTYTGLRVEKIKFTEENSIHAYYLHRNHSQRKVPELKTAGAWEVLEEKHHMGLPSSYSPGLWPLLEMGCWAGPCKWEVTELSEVQLCIRQQEFDFCSIFNPTHVEWVILHFWFQCYRLLQN